MTSADLAISLITPLTPLIFQNSLPIFHLLEAQL